MKKSLIIAIAFFVLAGAGICSNYVNNPKHTRMGVSYTMALSQDKPMLLYFYVDWCSYCQKFKPKLKLIDAIYKNAYSIVLINCDDPLNKKLVESYYVSSYPTLYLYDKKLNLKLKVDSSRYDNLEFLKKELDKFIAFRENTK